MICMFSKDEQKSHCILLKKCLHVQLQSTPKEVSGLKLFRKGLHEKAIASMGIPNTSFVNLNEYSFPRKIKRFTSSIKRHPTQPPTGFSIHSKSDCGLWAHEGTSRKCQPSIFYRK